MLVEFYFFMWFLTSTVFLACMGGMLSDLSKTVNVVRRKEYARRALKYLGGAVVGFLWPLMAVAGVVYGLWRLVRIARSGV